MKQLATSKHLPLLRLVGALAALVGSQASAATRIACVGNSITCGLGLSWTQKAYPALLDSLLGSADTVGNFGVSGKTMLKKVGDAYWTQGAFDSARAFLPAQVVIELGTNDIKPYIWAYYSGDFEADYKSMLDTFQHLSSSPRMWMCLAPPASNSSWGMYDTTVVDELNPRIREVALERGANLIDLHAAMRGHWEWFQSDSVHPDSAGALVLALTVRDLLQRVPFEVSKSGKVLTAPAAAGYQWYRSDTLLPGDTARTLAVADAGRYKVSLRISDTSQPRIVSEPFEVSSSTGLSAARSGQARIAYGASSRILSVEAGRAAPVAVAIRDLSGRPLLSAGGENGFAQVSTERLAPGVYSFVLEGDFPTRTGSLVVLPR